MGKYIFPAMWNPQRADTNHHQDSITSCWVELSLHIFFLPHKQKGKIMLLFKLVDLKNNKAKLSLMKKGMLSSALHNGFWLTLLP